MIKLYDYQQDLVTRTLNALRNGAHGVMIVSPAGSGKSVVIAELARLATTHNRRVLFLVHRQELAEQIEQSFRTQDCNMDFATIITVGKARNRLDTMPTPNLIIVDESHHARAKSYQMIFDYFAKVPRLGFTATPWRLNGEGFTDTYDVMVEGKTVQELIDMHRLAPVTYYSLPQIINRQKLAKNHGEFTNASINQQLAEQDERFIQGRIVDTWKKYAQDKQTIVYAPTVEFSKAVASMFNRAGITCAHCDGNTPAKERAEIMHRFKAGKIKILTNVDLISEGFNVPDCGCVVMLRPTKSLVLFIQQSMRCMRYQPNKQAIVLDQVGNAGDFGLPQTPHKWTLKSRKKQKGGGTPPEYEPVQCPECYATFYKKDLVKGKCPVCGFEITTGDGPKRGQLEVKDGELTVLTPDDFRMTTNYNFKHGYQAELAQLKNRADTHKMAVRHGYSSGWEYHINKSKGFI